MQFRHLLGYKVGEKLRRILAHLSSKGQMTLPGDARKALGVEPGQSIMVELHDDGRVMLTKPLYTVDTLNGILPALDPPPSADFEQEIHDSQLEMGKEFVRPRSQFG